MILFHNFAVIFDPRSHTFSTRLFQTRVFFFSFFCCCCCCCFCFVFFFSFILFFRFCLQIDCKRKQCDYDTHVHMATREDAVKYNESSMFLPCPQNALIYINYISCKRSNTFDLYLFYSLFVLVLTTCVTQLLSTVP